MSDTVQVPAVGRVKSKYVIAAGALIAGIVGYAYWRRAQAPVDIPAYGEGDITADGIASTPGGAAGAPANSGGASHDASTSPDTDQEWVRQAAELLSGVYPSGDVVYAALGAYITHQSVTADQEKIIRSAIGALGYPPGGHYPITTGTGASPSTVGAPSNVNATSTATEITVTWGAVAGAASYYVYRSDQSAPTVVTGTTARLSGFIPTQTYTVDVAAVGADGKVGPKAGARRITMQAVKLTAPTGVKGTPARTTIALVWNAVPGATHYHVYVNNVEHGAPDGRTYTIQSLRPNTSYKIQVRADTYNQSPGPASTTITVRTKK